MPRLSIGEGEPPPASALLEDEAGVAQPKPIEAIFGAPRVVLDLATIATGRLMAVALSFVTVLLTTRILSPAAYGTVALVGIVSMMIFTTSTSWTSIAVRRYGREELERQGSMSRLTWNRAAISAPLAAVCVVVVVILKLVGALPSDLSWPLTSIAVGTAVATALVDQWLCLLETSGKMKVSAAGQVLSQAAYVVILLGLFVSGSHATPALISTIALGSMVVLVIGAAPFVWRVGLSPPRGDRQLRKRMLWLSAPMIGFMISQYVFGSVDIVALRIFTTSAEAGKYAIAYQAYVVMAGIAVTATVVLVPLFVSMQTAGRGGLIVRYLQTAVPQGLFVIATVGGLCVPFVMRVVPFAFGSAFADAGRPLAILVAGLVLQYAAYLLSPILTLHERTRATAVINTIATMVNVVGDILLLGVFHVGGIAAPAVATTAALVFQFLAFHWQAERALQSKARIHPLLAAPLVGGLGITLTVDGWTGTVIGIAVAAALAAAIVVFRCPFQRDDIEFVEKLELPASVKSVAISVLAFLTRRQPADTLR